MYSMTTASSQKSTWYIGISVDNFYYNKFVHIYFLVHYIGVFALKMKKKKESRIVVRKFKRQLEVEEVLIKIARLILGDKH